MASICPICLIGYQSIFESVALLLLLILILAFLDLTLPTPCHNNSIIQSILPQQNFTVIPPTCQICSPSCSCSIQSPQPHQDHSTWHNTILFLLITNSEFDNSCVKSNSCLNYILWCLVKTKSIITLTICLMKYAILCYKNKVIMRYSMVLQNSQVQSAATQWLSATFKGNEPSNYSFRILIILCSMFPFRYQA